MHNFEDSLARSHAAEDLPFWAEVYREAFPRMVAMPNHRQDGDHQRQGIDRSVVLDNGKTYWIDEKVRGRNRKTGKVYPDIALEYLSDRDRNVAGWVCKSIMADYIAYAIAPLGRCYLLPVVQLQEAWRRHGDDWRSRHFKVEAHNELRGRRWVTESVAVPVREVFSAIGGCLRTTFERFDMYEDGKRPGGVGEHDEWLSEYGTD